MRRRSKAIPISGTLSLLHVRDFLSRQWRFIALVTGLAVILGVGYVAVTPSKYTAQADMIIDTKRATWTQSELTTENHPVEDPLVESEIETTKSEKVALSVINRLHLTEDPEFVGAGTGLKQRIFSLLGVSSGPQTEPSNDEMNSPCPGKAKGQSAGGSSRAQLHRADLLHVA